MGITYREAAGPGLAAATCLERAVVAYVAAGVVGQGSAKVVLDMITSLVIEEGDWLLGGRPEPNASGSLSASRFRGGERRVADPSPYRRSRCGTRQAARNGRRSEAA